MEDPPKELEDAKPTETIAVTEEQNTDSNHESKGNESLEQETSSKRISSDWKEHLRSAGHPLSNSNEEVERSSSKRNSLPHRNLSIGLEKGIIFFFFVSFYQEIIICEFQHQLGDLF